MPFIVATILALLLDPAVDRLEGKGMPRLVAVAVVFGLFFVIVAASASVLLPALSAQVGQLTAKVPAYSQQLQELYSSALTNLHHYKFARSLPTSSQLLQQLTTRATPFLQDSVSQITGFLLGSFSSLIELIVTLVVTFYMLVDIDRLRARLQYLVPVRARTSLRQITDDITQVFSDYLRGLVIVCILYGVSTLVLLYAMSLRWSAISDYALLVGVTAGLLYAVPYAGAFITVLITFLVVFAGGGIGAALWSVLFTTILNQTFDNLVAPKIVGGGVGLHPVIALFALSMGFALCGIPRVGALGATGSERPGRAFPSLS